MPCLTILQLGDATLLAVPAPPRTGYAGTGIENPNTWEDRSRTAPDEHICPQLYLPISPRWGTQQLARLPNLLAKPRKGR